ncbi:MAG: VIT1/CCC1 transporter family protein [Weeksellaceae bacterium]
MFASDEALEKHLQEQAETSPLAKYLREIVYGGNDGIVTTFAVVAGFQGAQIDPNTMAYMTVLLFGLANLFADATSMGLGNFLSLRAEKDQYHKERAKEIKRIETDVEVERAETAFMLKSHNFTAAEAEKIALLISSNKEYWIDYMMRYEFNFADLSKENPLLKGIATFLSFIVFGIIPLTPFIFLKGSPNSFMYAVIATTAALLLLGLLRWRVTEQSIIRAVGESLLVGGLSAGIAYAVGTFFAI